MRILIIGGTRFMGPLVVRFLYEQGHEVTVFHRGQNQAAMPEGVRELLGDRHSPAAFDDRLRELEPDVVLDMIPVTEQDAIAVMRAFTGVARRVVSISSQDVYRAFGRVNMKEL